MEEEVLLDSDFVKVWFVPNLSIGRVAWKRKPDKEEYKTGFMTLLEFAKKTKIKNFLSDIRKQGVVSPESRKWFEEYALPAAMELGLKRAGVIMDGNIFKKYYVNMLLSATNKYKLPLKVFSTEEDAYGWFQKNMEKAEVV